MSSIPADDPARAAEGEPLDPEPHRAARSEAQEEPVSYHATPAVTAYPAEALPGEALPSDLRIEANAGSADGPALSAAPGLIEPAFVEPPLFAASTPPELRRPVRIPHLGHLLLLLLIVVAGFAAAIVVVLIALRFHVYGISSIEQTKSDIHYTLGSEGLGYLFTLLGCLIVFPVVWNKPFFAGIQWNGATALRLRWHLVSAAFICFLLALLNSFVMPGPSHAPIEDIFRQPGAAWLLFAFGVTFAPFFEEMFFRGFLLPAFCTAFDWVAELVNKTPESSPVAGAAPRWTSGTWLVAATITAIPFAATCALASKRYLIVGAALLFAWCCSMALAWSITRRRAPASAASINLAPLDATGQPLWSFPAMACVSLFTSIPFALMHAPQTGFSVGPFLLLVGVSIVLCGIRLWTRSLAASTLVHASYNFMLFSMMLVGTQGFRHMEKM
ncbi:MAG TPA: CPBP family intramembrane glutamic endopeptidase [Terracidiphilus sp.]|jgi:hypothetical protein